MKSAIDALREAQRAQQEHDRRIDVQLALLTDAEDADKVNLVSPDRLNRGGDSDVAASDAKANTKSQVGREI